MQTILGAGGAIGKPLASELTKYTSDIRLVSRNPEKINETDELFTADLTDQKATAEAVRGSDVVYLVAGLPYSISVWREQWPKIMGNVIRACEMHGSRLVFFDNVYMYDPGDMSDMKEDHPIGPVSKKGEVRKEIAQMLMNAVSEGRIKALIARSADFYGPGIGQTSMLNEAVIKPLAQGKTATWLGSLKYRHSFTYTPDAAHATALLGNSQNAFGEVWHLPTAGNPPTGEEWVNRIAELLHTKPRVRAAPKLLMSFMGLFNPMMKELAEMVYQNDRDYVFNSQKIEQAFGLKPTGYEEGLKAVIRHDYPDRS